MSETFDGYSSQLWMNGLTMMDKFNIRHFMTLVGLIGIPESYLDVGCGTGATVKIATRIGIEAFGVDQLVEESWGTNFYHHNLVNPFALPHPVNLVTCFEVAEHLHETAHATLCDTLCSNLREGRGNYLVFSAARPGQGGTGHIACRPAEYWGDQFSLRQLNFNLDITMALGLLWSNIRTPLNYLWDNVMVFEK